MLPNPSSTDELLEVAMGSSLYTDLLIQLEKDFKLASEDFDCPPSMTPAELKSQLTDRIHHLLHFKYAELLNLLYIFDVPENAFKQLDGNDFMQLSEELGFLILRREWMKVWFRKNWK